MKYMGSQGGTVQESKTSSLSRYNLTVTPDEVQNHLENLGKLSEMIMNMEFIIIWIKWYNYAIFNMLHNDIISIYHL